MWSDLHWHDAENHTQIGTVHRTQMGLTYNEVNVSFSLGAMVNESSRLYTKSTDCAIATTFSKSTMDRSWSRHPWIMSIHALSISTLSFSLASFAVTPYCLMHVCTVDAICSEACSRFKKKKPWKCDGKNCNDGIQWYIERISRCTSCDIISLLRRARTQRPFIGFGYVKVHSMSSLVITFPSEIKARLIVCIAAMLPNEICRCSSTSLGMYCSSRHLTSEW